MIKSKIKIKIFTQHHFPPKFANRDGRIRNSEGSFISQNYIYSPLLTIKTGRYEDSECGASEGRGVWKDKLR